MGRPTKLDTDRRDRQFVLTLIETGSVDRAARISKVAPARLGKLLDRPDVRSVLKAAA